MAEEYMLTTVDNKWNLKNTKGELLWQKNTC